MKPLLKQTRIDFMKWRNIAMSISLVLVVSAIVSIVIRGLNFGIDFTGGTLIELGYGQPVKLDGIRETLSESGFERTTVQHFGTSHDVLVRLAPQAGRNNVELSDSVVKTLRVKAPGVEVRRIEFVGPQVGEELREDGGLAMVYALIGILVYVTLRFEYRFSFGSVIALVHDVIITVGFFSLTGIEFDLPVLAAVLAVIGYSLNDTIVVYDRIRENFRKMRKVDTVGVVNSSINQTLSRTLVTSLTTLLVLIALFLIGGSVIHSFALALIVGVIVGTYSSIYIASSSILMLGVSKKDLLPIQRETGETGGRP